MDALTILRRAQEVGLRIETAGDKLLVRGPKRAEPVVRLLAEHKVEVLAALAAADQDQDQPVRMAEAHRWRGRFASLAFAWSHGGDRNWDAARRLAWGDLENEWHELHGQRWPSWQCAACDAPIGGSQALNLPDGNRVHADPIDCLIRFGRRWRGEARAALIALGLEPPHSDGNPL
jgi:hypothetical protein